MMTNNNEFTLGSEVIYGLHGRCSIKSIETKKIGGETLEFYKLELLVKNPIVKTMTKKDTAIWLPVNNAKKKGLRLPIHSQEGVDAAYAILESREYYLPLETNWKDALPQLENMICTEGSEGLAKAISFSYALKESKAVPPSEVTKFYDNAVKQLAREVSEVIDKTVRLVEEEIETHLKHKMKPDA